MKLVLEPLTDVVLDTKELPKCFTWHKRRYLVNKVTNNWVWAGKWWTSAELASQKRSYFTVETNFGTCELYCENAHWMLSRVWD